MQISLFEEANNLELNLVSKDKKSILIELTDVKETIVHPLIERLLNDNDVLLASYKTGHPQLDKPRLTVKTQRVNPETAVKKAADSLAEEIKAMKKEFEKVEKSTKARKTKPKKAKPAKKKPAKTKKATKAKHSKKKATKAKKGVKKKKKKSK